VQGWLVTWLNIPAIAVTLATYIGLQGLSLELRPIVVIVAAFEYILFHTGLGRRLRAVGSNPLGATRVGIRVNRQILLAFTLSGLLSGIAGLVLAGQVGIGFARHRN
jgi:ribose/xylose/arabinose/galactoside ABC-type transport system permease subunit